MSFATPVRVLALAAILGTVVALQPAPSFAGNNKQVFMERALQHLEEARRQLSKATPNKGGHRAQARKLTTLAIDEVKKGIRYAEKN